VEPERLVYDHGDDDVDGLIFHVTVTFTAQGARTQVTMRAVFDSPAQRDQVVRDFGAIEGANQTLDRLGDYLTTM
jgi:uncharacterized protein YndB with AHSA1/START domain